MSRYKDHRGPKRRGYDEDYTPDYHAAERQPEYFSPRPTLTQGSEPVEASVKWFNADKGFGFVTVAGGSDAFLPSRALVLLCHKFWCPFRAAQHGQRESVVARAATNLRRIVAIEFGTWRSGRNGGSSGLVTFA